MKRRSLLIIIAVAILLASCILCACNSNDIPSGVPVDWLNYLEEVATVFANEVLSYDSLISVKADGEMILNGRPFTITVRGNFDRNNNVDSNIAFIMTDADDNTVVSVLSDNNNTYIDIAPNPYVDNAKLKLQQTCLFSQIGKDISGDVGIKKSFIEFGKIMFQNADVNADKSKYTFSINGGALGERILDYLKAIELLDEEIGSVILNILGIKNKDELIDLFSLNAGKVNFYITDNRIVKVDTADISFAGDKDGYFSCNILMGEEYDDGVKNLFPETDAGYKVTKVGSTSMDGTLSLIASEGNKYAITYDMSMNTNVDLMRLVFNGFDLESLGDDNFFHFRLSHKCSNSCSRYCINKLSRANGAVLDIAFAPSQFGTSNIYVCYNLRSFIELGYVREITKYDVNISEISIPEYAMFVLPAANLKNGNSFMNILYQTYISLMGIEVGDTATVDINAIRSAFRGIRVADVLFANMFDTEEYGIDTVRYRINQNIYGQARDYDIKKETVYLRAYDEAELKKYTTALGRDYTAYEWSYEERVKAGDGGKQYNLNNIYDLSSGNLLHGADGNGKYVPLSDKEAQGLIGCAVKAESKGYNGNLRTVYCEILGIEGLDVNCFDVQEVRLKVRYPNALDYSFEFGDISYKMLEALFQGGSEIFVQELKANIKLTRERADNSFEFKSADLNKKYRLTATSSTIPELLKATAVIYYDNGMSKEIVTIGKSSSVLESQGILSRKYSITDWGRISVNFNVAGRGVNRYFEVEKPTRFDFDGKGGNGEIGNSCSVSNFASLVAYYGDTRINVRLSLGDFYINNISLSDDAADWKVYDGYTDKTVVFYKSNDYIVEVRKCGMVFGEFTLKITGVKTLEATYKYNANTKPQNVVLSGARNAFSGTLTNATHGDGTPELHTFDVKVMEYYNSATGISVKEAAKEDYTLTFEMAGVKAEENSLQIELPVMIVEPINVRFSVTITKAGIYRIALRMDAGALLTSGIIYEFTVNVLA